MLPTGFIYNFVQFINACTPHLKIPGDEPIMAKLRRHYGKIDPVYRKTRKFYSEMSRFILQVQNSDIYVIIQEVLIYFKSCNAKSSSKKQAHIKKLESYLEVTKHTNLPIIIKKTLK